MPPKDPAPTEDLLQIQIAIELDRGRKVAEIASEFHVPEKKVRNIARNAGLLESKKSSSARKRLSEEEKEVLLGRIEAGEDPEELASGVGIKTSTLLRWCKVKGIEDLPTASWILPCSPSFLNSSRKIRKSAIPKSWKAPVN